MTTGPPRGFISSVVPNGDVNDFTSPSRWVLGGREIAGETGGPEV